VNGEAAGFGMDSGMVLMLTAVVEITKAKRFSAGSTARSAEW
jgi:hypothetical protein